MKVNGKDPIPGLLQIVCLVIFTQSTLQQGYPAPGYPAYPPPAAGYAPGFQPPSYFPNPHRRRMYSSFAPPPRRRVLRVQEEFLGGEPSIPEFEDDGYIDAMPQMEEPPAPVGWQQRNFYGDGYAPGNPNMMNPGQGPYSQLGYGPQMGPINGVPSRIYRKLKGRNIKNQSGKKKQSESFTSPSDQWGKNANNKKEVRTPSKRKSETKLRKIQHKLIRWRHRVYHLQQNQEALSLSSKIWKNLTIDLHRFRSQQKHANQYNARMTRHRKELNFRVNREYMYAASLNMEELLYKQQRGIFRAMKDKTDKFNKTTIKNLSEYYDQKGNSASDWVSKELQDIFY
jgi:hypothetical protein